MNMLQFKSVINNWTSPAIVLRRLIPLAYGVFLTGFAISIAIYSSQRTPTLENGIISDLLSCIDNPHGYFFSSISAVICSMLLLPTASLFQRGWKNSHRRWTILGAWLFRIGLITTIVIEVTTSLQQPYSPFHIWISLFAFMSTVAGLAFSIWIAVYYSDSNKFWLLFLGVLHILALIFLLYVFLSFLGFFTDIFKGHRGFLAVFEWSWVVLIGASVVALVIASDRASNPK